jgi:hypothetical protein
MGEKEALVRVAPVKDSSETACIRNSKVQRRNKTNTEILASPE